MSRFIQIHFLTAYPGTLLNRDDMGAAKRLPFGGAVRTRVSSQCLKRHWRKFEGEHSLRELGPESVRSRFTFEREIVKPLMADHVPEAIARAVTTALMEAVLGKSEKSKKADEAAKKKAGPADKAKKDEVLQTSQLTVLGRPEIDFLLGLARTASAGAKDAAAAVKAVTEKLDKDAKQNLDRLRLAAGLDAALFGRMVTSDILARGDAALHVAHAFTVHKEATEPDYFTAVDDLLGTGDDEGATGSAHINSSELTSGLFYGYVVVDVPLLVCNLESCKREDWAKADRKLAADVVKNLVHMVATVSPGAKLGSTAPYSHAHAVLVESGNSQPRTLANAFLKPVSEKPDLLLSTYQDLARYVKEDDTMYDSPVTRALSAVGPSDVLREALKVSSLLPLSKLAAFAGGQVVEG